LAGATDRGICLLEFTERRMLEAQFATIRRRFDLPILPGESDYLRQLRVELGDYFSGARHEFTVPLVYPGTPFEQQVWAELLRNSAGVLSDRQPRNHQGERQ
jgi:AraC family transcriptional regulator of adaptative response/methylated-DNA-[protein]-cysteine methyltransferase